MSARNHERTTLIAIVLSGTFATLGIGLFSFTLPLLSLDDAVSGAWLGTAFSGYFFAKLMVSPASGFLSDKVGPKRLFLFATGFGACIPLFHFLYSHLIVLYFIQFGMGMIAGLVKPLGLATLGGLNARTKLTRWISLHAFALSVALLIGPLAGGLLYYDREIGPVLSGLSVCMFLAFLVVLFLLPRESSTRVASDNGNEFVEDNVWERAAVLVAICGRAIGIGLLTAFYPILLSMTLGLTGVGLATLYVVPSLTMCLGLPFFGRWLKGQAMYLASVVGLLVSAGALFALGACQTVLQFIVFGGLMGAGAALSIPATMTLVSDTHSNQGRIFGIAHTAAGIGFLVGPLLGGMVVTNYHFVGHAMMIASVIGGSFCIPLLFVTLRKQFHWGVAFSSVVSAGCLILIGGFGSMYFIPMDNRSIVQEDGLYTYTDVAMGTVVNLTLMAGSQKAADDASKKALSAMRMLQKDFDHRDPHGSIGRINRGAGKHWVAPSGRAFDLIQRTLAFSAETNGVFDPTIGALTTSPLYFVLDESIAESKKHLVDYQKVLVHEDNRRVKLRELGMALDMGGIAKGAIIDTVVKLLRNQGIEAGIVEAGGDFYCFGDRDWTIGVRHPREDTIHTRITVREKGVCGSGDYQQFVSTGKGDERLIQHHIVNPADMASADESAGVTVIAQSAEKADALATAVFIMGPLKGKVFMEERYPDDAAIWFTPDLSVVMTDNFPK